MVIEYIDFLPASIIPRLMVKLNKYILEDHAWKTGVVLKEALILNSVANIVLDKENKKISIEVVGKRRRDFLSVIRETIKEINSSYQEIEIVEWIPLPELHRGEELLIDYTELLGYESEGIPDYFSGRLRKKFKVSELLNGLETPQNRIPKRPIRLFLSYAKEDILYKERLKAHLTPLIRLNSITVWDDGCLIPGEPWEKQIHSHLTDAELFLCLISADFIKSDFNYSEELSKAIADHEKGEKTVVPICIRPCLWDSLPIKKLKSLPNGDWLGDIENESAWLEIVRGVEKVITHLQKTS
ncbi:MAG: TIR domain-containing protein [Bacteroidota bacterium]